jgi:hypothetical protein
MRRAPQFRRVVVMRETTIATSESNATALIPMVNQLRLRVPCLFHTLVPVFNSRVFCLAPISVLQSFFFTSTNSCLKRMRMGYFHLNVYLFLDGGQDPFNTVV